MSMRVHGTCHRRACDGWQPAHGSPLSHVFLRNLQRRQARSFRDLAGLLPLLREQRAARRPTFFSTAPLPSLPDDDRRMTALVGLAMGLFLGPLDSFLDGGEDERAPEPEPEPERETPSAASLAEGARP